MGLVDGDKTLLGDETVLGVGKVGKPLLRLGGGGKAREHVHWVLLVLFVDKKLDAALGLERSPSASKRGEGDCRGTKNKQALRECVMTGVERAQQTRLVDGQDAHRVEVRHGHNLQLGVANLFDGADQHVATQNVLELSLCPHNG